MRSLLLLLVTLAPTVLSAGENPLDDTHWELVTIQSMDDTSDTPADPSRYTLAFAADGTVSIQSDCNQATGTWTAKGSQLSFGSLAATLALCPPPSLDEVYRAQFEWVRSYVMRGGNLFLATMADGSIIEFRPLEEGKAMARVLGETINNQDPQEVQSLVLTRLFDDYADKHGLAATEAEVTAYLADMDRRLKEDLGDDYQGLDDLSAEEAVEVRQMRSAMAASMIRQWKINRSLYKEYGGRVIFQQLGPEPLDAYREYLEARRKAGDFEILDPGAKQVFWEYFTDESRHDFYEPGSEEVAQAFALPPWERSR